MGKYNSSLTRVVPLIDHLSKLNDFPQNLISIYNTEFNLNEEPIEICYGKFEKKIMPAKSLLKHLINNIHIINKDSLGSDNGTKSYKNRIDLFALDEAKKLEALQLIENDKNCYQKWYVFEGYTHPDIYIETDNYILIGEAKRTEKSFTTKTKWLNERDQLLRHIDSVLDSGKQVISFLIIDNELKNTAEYKIGLARYKDREYFKKHLPHRSEMEINIAMKSYIGFTTWQKYEEKFKIEYIDQI